jgi:hypothetical protein
MVLGPGVSWIGEVYSLQIALLVTGGTFFVFGGGVIFLMHRARIL